MIRAAAHYSAAALPGLAVPVCGPPRASASCLGHYRVSPADRSVHIAISIAVTCYPRPSDVPRGNRVPNGLPGRSCFRATPAWSTRSRREDGGWDALRFVSLTEATEPEHCSRIQIVVGKLPGLPGDRTGRTVLEVGPRPAARRSLRSGHGFPVRRKDVAQQGRLKLAEPVPDQRAVGAGGVAGVPGRWGLHGGGGCSRINYPGNWRCRLRAT